MRSTICLSLPAGTLTASLPDLRHLSTTLAGFRPPSGYGSDGSPPFLDQVDDVEHRHVERDHHRADRAAHDRDEDRLDEAGERLDLLAVAVGSGRTGVRRRSGGHAMDRAPAGVAALSSSRRWAGR